MQYVLSRKLVLAYLCLVMSASHAETLYVTDKLDIGIHQDRSISSPILKLVPSGTALTVIERVDDLIQVQEPEGTKGWINSKYTVKDKPGRASLVDLQNKNKELQTEIERLKTANPAATNTASDQQGLEQQLNTERLKVGELQAQLADIKANIANVDNSSELLADIEQLRQENQQLIAQLESSGIEVKINGAGETNSLAINNWKQILIYLGIALIIGMVLGAFLLDYLNRRRHGGFRV